MDERVLTPEGHAALMEELLTETYHVDTLFDLDALAAERPPAPAPTHDTDITATVASLTADIAAQLDDDATPRNGMSPTRDHRPISLLARRPRIVDTTRWQDAAVCVIDPRATNAETREDETKALAMCALCPVRAQCRAWADGEAAFQGVAGGQVYGDPRAKANPRPADTQTTVGPWPKADKPTATTRRREVA